MANYTVINELHSFEFHDSFLDNAYIEDDDLHIVFSDAIIIGHSRLDIQGRIPCSVNHGEDRYACPQLSVTLKGFSIHSVLRYGCRIQDAEGNTIEEYPPHILSPDEYSEFLLKILAAQGNHVYGLTYDTETKIFSLCFCLNADDNYYEMEFTAETAIAQFEAFGKEAWYLDSKWRKYREGQ